MYTYMYIVPGKIIGKDKYKIYGYIYKIGEQKSSDINIHKHKNLRNQKYIHTYAYISICSQRYTHGYAKKHKETNKYKNTCTCTYKNTS